MITLAERIAAVFDHLGLDQAFVATQTASPAPHLSLTPEAFAPLGDRLLLITGDSGVPADIVNAAMAALPRAAISNQAVVA